ncbi:(d)CMP kinase [Rhodoligotrophos defluvii]|uniref:(d)CMP kinase n=1 Tax=Rhodoligotrophos defluvii TaxID=2561934 RepID=UPI0010C9911C|nr:(d)CMP kinase [Rhodoligotrophos defluvii]
MSNEAKAPKARKLVIALDGPAASGKGTLARKLAQAFDLAHLDTGALYRAVAAIVLRAGINETDEDAVVLAVGQIGATKIEENELRSTAVGRVASVVAAMPKVRAALLDYQRNFAASPPDDKEGAVLDGRDIGTVVCPAADVKFFVTASVEERARRRHAELQSRGERITYEAVLAELRDRDARDCNRAQAPLRQAEDAVLLDTTELDIETAFRQAVDIIARRKGLGVSASPARP